MGLIHIDLFTTLDLVAQAPAPPTRTPRAASSTAVAGTALRRRRRRAGRRRNGRPRRVLLGRKTYDIFAAYWPHQEDGVDAQVSRLFNEVPKYVASRGNPALDWPDRLCSGRISRGRSGRYVTATQTSTSSAASTSPRPC